MLISPSSRRFIHALGATTITLVIAIVVAACGSSDASSSASGASGTDLRALIPLEPANLDPAQLNVSYSNVGLLSVPIYGSLIDYYSGGEVKPELATSVTGNSDGSIWTIKLRQGVKFSDGTPFNAEAVVFNWKRDEDPKTASPCAATIANFSSFKAVDETTVQVTLAEPRQTFPSLISNCAGLIGSPTAIKADGDKVGTSPQTTVGAGPFMVKEWVRGDHITMIRNPHYWQAGRPKLSEMTIRIVSDPEQLAQALIGDTADTAVFSQVPTQLQQVKDAGLRLVGIEDQGGTGLTFNTSKAPLNDRRVREALADATDLSEANQEASGGLAPIAETWFAKSSPNYNPALKQHLNNLSKGQQLIDEYVAQHGGPVKITINSTSGNAWITAIQQQWSRLKGVQIELRNLSPTAYAAAQIEGDYQVTLSKEVGADPETLYEYIGTGQSLNICKYSNKKVDALLLKARTSADPTTQLKLMEQAIKLYFEDVDTILLYHTYTPTGLSKQVKTFPLLQNGVPDYADIQLSE